MAFFDDMTAALEAYPLTDVQIAIEDVTVPGSALNVSETGSFRVRVTNTGPLILTGVTVRVVGQNGARVANNGAVAPFVTEFVTQEFPTIAAHGGSALSSGGTLKFLAPNAAQASKTLVKVTLENWDANLDHILLAHSDPLSDGPKGTYAAQVFAA